ncbi:MAG: type III-A CRISPR-associated protein Csm2 [Candidatus Anstonellaceae archaeon]
MNEELFLEDGAASNRAKELVEEDYTVSQLRNFLNHLETIELKLKDKQNYDPQKQREFLKFEIAKIFPLIANSQTRQRGGGKPMPEKFAKDLKDRLKKIETLEDFELFLDYYRAVVCYFNYYFDKKRRESAKKYEKEGVERYGPKK